MSARTEAILANIEQTKKQLHEALVKGDGPSIARAQEVLSNLNQELTQANQALTEGRQILKG